MNIFAVFNTGLGKGRNIEPVEYTNEQIEEVLTTGSLEDTPDQTEDAERNCKLCSKPNARRQYGVVSCKACRVFFFRTITKFKKLQCAENQDCSDGCTYCRLKKCLNAGMNVLAVRNTSMGRGQSVEPFNYSSAQIEEILTTGKMRDEPKMEKKEYGDIDYRHMRLATATTIAQKEGKFMVSFFL